MDGPVVANVLALPHDVPAPLGSEATPCSGVRPVHCTKDCYSSDGTSGIAGGETPGTCIERSIVGRTAWKRNNNHHHDQDRVTLVSPYQNAPGFARRPLHKTICLPFSIS